jgi:hypothetical protein
MADITMCKNETCPMKNRCYRYTAIPSDYQSYSNFGLVDQFWQVLCEFWIVKK